MASGPVCRTLKAEHMAASTNAANVKKALANSEPSTHGTTLRSLRCTTLSVRRGISLGMVCPLMMWWTAPTLRHRSAIGWLR